MLGAAAVDRRSIGWDESAFVLAAGMGWYGMVWDGMEEDGRIWKNIKEMEEQGQGIAIISQNHQPKSSDA